MSKDNIRELFAPNGGYCVCYPSKVSLNKRSFETWGISLGYSPLSFSQRIFSHAMRLDQSRASKNI